MEHIQAEITDKQRANLKTLADFLASGKPAFHFDMAGFAEIPGDRNLSPSETLKLYCDTAACAAGHGPTAGIMPHRGEDWDDYIDRCFIGPYKEAPGCYAFAWCFGGGWFMTDNSREGAAARIYYFLEHGVPKNSSQQQQGFDPLCYRVEK